MTTAVDIFIDAKKGYLAKRGGLPDPSSPSKMIPQTTWGDVTAFGMTFLRFVDSGSFERTLSYQTARSSFSAFVPRIDGAFGGIVEKNANVLYPSNQQFWNAGVNLAIARGGAGLVLSGWEIAKESVKETVGELGSNLRKAFEAIPGVGMLITILKWSLVAGAGFLLWNLYQRTRPAKREELGP